jgi:hypothetical protein
MTSVARRNFLISSLGGLAALQTEAFAAEKDGTKSSSKSSNATPKPSQPHDTLFLTWQRDPTTTITVQWVGPAPGKDVVQVEYTALGDTSTWKPLRVQTKEYYPTSDLRVFRAEATGLKPGTEYQLRIGKKSPAYRFRTMPAKLTDTFQFVSGGDCGANDHVIANNILAAKQNPMFALIGGDIAYDNGHDVKTNLAFLQNYHRHMIDGEGRLIPMVTCIGNHEVKGGYGAERTDGPLFFGLHDGLYAERSFATLDFGDYLSLVLLDSGHVAPIDGEQAYWLDKKLAERADLAHLFVANHVPAYPSYRAPESSDGKGGTGALQRTEWAPLFEKHLVDVVLEHHDHTFKRTHPLKNGHVDANGVMYLGDGSWGKLRAPKQAEDRPYLAAVDEAYHLTVHRLEGERRFHMALEEGGGVVDVCMTQKRLRRKMGRSG